MDTKLVLVLREGLPPSVAANATAVLTLSLGGAVAGWLGADGVDASGHRHPGLNAHPVPVVTADGEQLRDLRQRAADLPDVTMVAFSEVARRAREYGEYLQALARTAAEDVEYLGVVVFGPRNRVTKLTKRFALLA